MLRTDDLLPYDLHLRKTEMTSGSLMESLRCCSRPVVFLAGVCLAVGLLFLSLDSGVGWIFIVAAGAAMVTFGIRAAIGRSGAKLRKR